MPLPVIDPIALSLGPIEIRWYGLAYIAGFACAWLFLRHLAKTGRTSLSSEAVDNLMTAAMIGVIAGGRIGSILFYNLGATLADPASVLRTWEGGMSFHGGLIGVAIAVCVFAWRSKLSVLAAGDLAAIAAPFGLFFGRVANFTNGELWGRPTDLPWGVIFPRAGPEPRHPSQLYEALLEGPVLFAILAWLLYRNLPTRRPGVLAGVFLIGYGTVRFMIEMVREPDANLGVMSWGLTMGQTLCLPMLAAGAVLLAVSGGLGGKALPDRA